MDKNRHRLWQPGTAPSTFQMRSAVVLLVVLTGSDARPYARNLSETLGLIGDPDLEYYLDNGLNDPIVCWDVYEYSGRFDILIWADSQHLGAGHDISLWCSATRPRSACRATWTADASSRSSASATD
jgi:hypothetical protein